LEIAEETVNIKAFEGLEGKKISVMLNRVKPNGEPESYIR